MFLASAQVIEFSLVALRPAQGLSPSMPGPVLGHVCGTVRLVYMNKTQPVLRYLFGEVNSRVVGVIWYTSNCYVTIMAELLSGPSSSSPRLVLSSFSSVPTPSHFLLSMETPGVANAVGIAEVNRRPSDANKIKYGIC